MEEKKAASCGAENKGQDGSAKKGGGQVAQSGGSEQKRSISNPVKGLRLNIRPIYG